MTTLLPDCRDVADPFWLPPELRRELLLLIAEKGEAGIEEFVRRHERDDSTIGRRIARLKARLLEEAAELRRRLKSQFDEAREAERERVARVLERLRKEEDELRKKEAAAAARLPAAVEAAVRTVPLLEVALAPPRLSLLQRVWNAVRRFAAWLWYGLLGLFGRRREARGKAKAIAIGVPGLAGAAVSIELDLESALRQNPALRKRIRQRLGDTWRVRTRRLWRILLGLDDYARVAQQIMEEEARRAAEEKGTSLRHEIDRLEQERRDREAAEQKSAAEAEAELRRLDEAERLEEARLKETIAARPAEDVRDLVVGELEAGGLVRRLGGEVQVTGRFLERLAAIVYAEESRGLGGTHESPIGSTIEGEGILERTPLLSHDETSHMDTVASLLQARTRHPHVRHLLEEDVLVYRERRAGLTHVVLILDKSLSMAENRRMEAGKRAVLALYWGLKNRAPQNRIDVLLMDTSVVRADLGQAWETKPSGFTNTGRALEAARALLRESRATRKLLFLVTDGLPEALTLEGKDVAGRPEEAMAYAIRQAERLRDVKGLTTTIVLLEPKDPLFVKAGDQLARRSRGKVVKVTPDELTRSLLVELREQAAAPGPAIPA
jgi:Mg-chelatase subunit ChlD